MSSSPKTPPKPASPTLSLEHTIIPYPQPEEHQSTSDHDSEQKTKSKRPVSYPWGPETNPDSKPETPVQVGYKLAKRNSDPLKSVSGNGNKARTQVKPFTKESLERLEKKTMQLVREYGFQPRRKLSVEDGSRLPSKYEPFPSKLYGRPLEEIDNFIYDEAIDQVEQRQDIYQSQTTASLSHELSGTTRTMESLFDHFCSRCRTLFGNATNYSKRHLPGDRCPLKESFSMEFMNDEDSLDSCVALS